jgi:uncharacterized repeat protein (TIGR03803 family)
MKRRPHITSAVALLAWTARPGVAIALHEHRYMLRLPALRAFVICAVGGVLASCNGNSTLPVGGTDTSAQSGAHQTTATENVLYRFSGADGALPQAGLIFDAAGNLYGTTTYGGTNSLGTVFELSPSHSGWTEQVLHSFGPLSQGEVPDAALSSDGAGNLFSTTTNSGPYYNGLVYEMSRDGSAWKYSIVHAFSGLDGSSPESGAIVHAGNLFGTTASGGPGGSSGGGVLFELSRSGGSWVEKRLHLFKSSGSAPSYPQGGLVRDPAGDLYGTTTYGGITGPCNVYPCGTVYEQKPGSHGVHTMYAFKGGSDGQNPIYGLTRDASGNLYGTTFSTVFELSQKGGGWKETILHSFPASGGNGRISEVALDSSGNVYGVTDFGGDSECFQGGCGFVYSLMRKHGSWSYSVLHTFTGNSDGAFPNGPLVLDAAGNLYGTTSGGDSGTDLGTIFEITAR